MICAIPARSQNVLHVQGMMRSRVGMVALCLFATLVAAYVSIFVADGHRFGAGIVADGLANAAAIAIMTLGVVALTRAIRWHHARCWWFLPLHLGFAVLTALGSLAIVAVALGVSAWLQTSAFTLIWFTGPARHWHLFTSVFIYAAVAGSAYAVQVAQDARDAQRLRQDAELAALRAQLDPHVLLNTLHALIELVRGHDDRAEEAVDRFGRLVRYLTAHRSAQDELVSLAEEWQCLEDYLHLESLRLGPRLTLALALDPLVRQTRLPALTLQPLAENAIRHGIGPRPGRGQLRIIALPVGDTVEVRVHDDGLGALASGTNGSGRGLVLVAARLRAHFGARAPITWGSAATGGWDVVFTVPRVASVA